MTKRSPHLTDPLAVGIIGFGAFGKLMASHLAPHMALLIHDPVCEPQDEPGAPGRFVPVETAAASDIVILAAPVGKLKQVVEAIAPWLRPGALVIDVGSVKSIPAQIMQDGLPRHVEIIGTHPLFGPQSAQHGIAGLKIAICPIRGQGWRRVAAFCRKRLGLKVIVTTAEAHDREAAMVQGLTHLIAKVLVQMEPLPQAMTTRSFELLMEGVEMVRHDSPEVFEAIERMNPFVPTVRRTFFDLAAELDRKMGATDAGGDPEAVVK